MTKKEHGYDEEGSAGMTDKWMREGWCRSRRDTRGKHGYDEKRSTGMTDKGAQE